MSSSEGLERLKNWQRAEKALVLPSVKSGTWLFEVGVKVLSVDDSTLVLAKFDSPSEIEKIDIQGATFSSDKDEADLQLTLTDGKKVYLCEKD